MIRLKNRLRPGHVGPAEIQALRDSLLRERETTSAWYREDVGAAREIQPEGIEDPEEIASMELDRSFLYAMGEADWERLEQIEDALRRIDEGCYGLCLFGGEPIPLARLREIPWARYCTEHQALAEDGLLAMGGPPASHAGLTTAEVHPGHSGWYRGR